MDEVKTYRAIVNYSLDSSYGPAGTTTFAFIDEGSLKPLVLQDASAPRAVVFQHTHPARAYIILTCPGWFGRGAEMPPSS